MLMPRKESPPLLLPSRFPIGRPRRVLNKRVGLLILTLASVLFLFHTQGFRLQSDTTTEDLESTCPQTPVLLPQNHRKLWDTVGRTFSKESFRSLAVEWVAGAVQVPTESYDHMDPVGVDPRWEAFGPFHDYLLKAFPLIHSTLSLRKVNTYGLLYVWQGSDVSLKPVLLAAHQDVVPVNPTTVDEWIHPPYSGYFDGNRLWGRGSTDDKGGLISIMVAIEILLENNFKPTRSVVLAFGFDEEANGIHGASELSKTLLSRFGEYGFSFLVDEGGMLPIRSFVRSNSEGVGSTAENQAVGYTSDDYGGIVAFPGIAEKGYFDVRLEVSSPGGHSSLPPPHTSIGILASLLVKYEQNPVQARLVRNSPLYKSIQCRGEHAPLLPPIMRILIKRSMHSDKSLRTLETLLFKDEILKSLAGTTQAIDLINGGVKTNALPERAWAVVNHRIATESSVAAVKARDTELLKKVAWEFNLTYNAFGVGVSDQHAPSRGTLTLSDAWNTALEPAPVSPSGEDATAYQLLSGTIKATYNAHRSIEGDNIYVSPGIMSGNTDTRHYWKLTKNIFRYSHRRFGNSTTLLDGIHTINESIEVDALLEMIRFYATLILNADESTSL